MASSSGDPFHAHPRKTFLLVIILVVALAASAYAYLRSMFPQGGPQVSITSPPMEFSMELDKAEYQFGGNITIIFCLKNISNETITIVKPEWYSAGPDNVLVTKTVGADIPQGAHLLSRLFHFDFSIMNSSNTEIYRWTQDRLAIAGEYELVLDPDGYVKQTLFWDYDSRYGNIPLPRDTYQLRGTIHYFGISLDQLSTLETPPIMITIE